MKDKEKLDCFRQGHLPLGYKKDISVYSFTGADQKIPDKLRLHSWGKLTGQLG